jgi:hypothetical protein
MGGQSLMTCLMSGLFEESEMSGHVMVFGARSATEEKVTMALDILEDAEVMQEFEDSVWLKIPKEDWELFKQEV